jgi:NMD protein affecting ribosome stability and mRNA decay
MNGVKGKGLVRAGNRRGTQSKKATPVERRTGRLPEPAVCERCGAIFTRRTWRRDRKVTDALLNRAVWTECPACKQARQGEYWGRVVVRGAYAAQNEEAIRRRIQNTAAQAQLTQPERRVVSAERDGTVLEVLTTSQKLAHRIAHELKKAFHGRTAYRWSDDGSLYAIWERD